MSTPTNTLRAVDLQAGNIYVSPTGRLCKLLPAPAKGLGSGLSRTFLFAYLSREGLRKISDGFALTDANVCHLRLFAGISTARGGDE
jgi:hypothetical protein